MSTLRLRLLLRECIKEIITEDESGGDIGGGNMGDMMSPFGMHYASQEQLMKIFVNPFTDVVKTAAGNAKELSQKAQTVGRIAFESLVTTLIPIYSDSYKEIFEAEKEKIDKIKSDYSDVYKSNWNALKNSDLLCAAFMYRPDLFLTAKFAEKAPKAAAQLVSVLSGGALDKTLNKLHLLGDSGGSSHGSRDEARWHRGALLFEKDDEEKQEPSNDVKKLIKLLSNKKVKDVLARSQKVQQMTKVGQELAHDTLQQVFDQAKATLTSKSLQDVQAKLGKKIPGLEKLAQIPAQERQKAEQDLFKGMKSGVREFYVKQLTAQIGRAHV